MLSLDSIYPDVAVRLVEFRHTDDLIEAMQAGRADVAVGPTPPDWEGPIREIGAETFWLAGPRDSGPLTGPTIDLSELSDAQWVHFTPPSGLADILDEACHAAGFTPHAAVRTEQSASALNLAKAGLGITLVPGNVIPANFEGSIAEPRPPVQRPLSVYTRTSPDPITAAFIDAIADEALANPGPLARPT